MIDVVVVRLTVRAAYWSTIYAVRQMLLQISAQPGQPACWAAAARYDCQS